MLHRLDSVIAYHPRITRRLGAERAPLGAATGARTSPAGRPTFRLGLLLGLVPPIVGFFGIPVEVRHVTLVSPDAIAAQHLGPGVRQQPGAR